MTDILAALNHLADAGVDLDAILAEDVDPMDSTGLRALVDDLILSLTDGDSIGNAAQLVHLQEAREALLTEDEQAERDRLAARLVSDLESYLTSQPRTGDPS